MHSKLAGSIAHAGMGSDPRTTRIVILATNGALFQGLGHAIEEHLAHAEVHLLGAPSDTELPDIAVKLVLLHQPGSGGLDACIDVCRIHYPNAAIGLVIESMEGDHAESEALFHCNRVQGLLPLDFNLEVWLAAMSLLLSGGEFYPFTRTKPQLAPVADFGMPELRIAPPPPPEAGRAPDLPPLLDTHHLTPRERQILELVSQGYPNKLIASRLALSEHTVKIHVHNLIGKLKVSNRTQAAAVFRGASSSVPLHASL